MTERNQRIWFSQNLLQYPSDEIALEQKAEAQLAGEELQVWTLIVEGSSALPRCDDGNDRRLLEKQIDFTDFPEPCIKLYVVDGVIMLPGEH